MSLWKRFVKACRVFISPSVSSRVTFKVVPEAPPPTSVPDETEPSTLHDRFAAHKTAMDSTLASVAAEQVKLDEEFYKTVQLTRHLQENAKKTAKVIRHVS